MVVHEQVIWTLGIESKKADKSISWTEKIPNFADPNVIIIDLGSLTQEILDSIPTDELKTISTTIYDKLLNGGTVVFITSQIVYNKSKSFSNYHLCPLKITVNNVPEGTHINYDEQNPFVNYLKNVKKFEFYLKGFDSFDNRYEIAGRINGSSFSEIEIERVPISRIDDNAGRSLGGIYNIYSNERGPLSGDLVLLPPLTENTIDKSIDDVIDTVKRISRYGYLPIVETNSISTEKPSNEIKSLQEGQLEDRYKILTSDDRKSEIYKGLYTLTFLGVFFFGLSTYTQYAKDPNSILAILSLIGFVICVGYLIAYFKFIVTKSLNKLEKNFVKFFNVYLALKEYEYRPNYNIDKVIKSIISLAEHVETWYSGNTPKDLAELPKSIVDTLRNGIIPSVKAKTIDHQNLKKYFFNYSSSIYDLEPNTRTLTELNIQLKSLQTESSPKPKIKKKSNKFSFLKLILISPISGLVIYFSFIHYWPDKTFESASLGVGSAIAIMLALVQLTKRK